MFQDRKFLIYYYGKVPLYDHYWGEKVSSISYNNICHISLTLFLLASQLKQCSQEKQFAWMTWIHSMGTLSYLRGMSQIEVALWQSPNICVLNSRIQQLSWKHKVVPTHTKREREREREAIAYFHFRLICTPHNVQWGLQQKDFNVR